MGLGRLPLCGRTRQQAAERVIYGDAPAELRGHPPGPFHGQQLVRAVANPAGWSAAVSDLASHAPRSQRAGRDAKYSRGLLFVEVEYALYCSHNSPV
jgi:hypothetical protein